MDARRSDVDGPAAAAARGDRITKLPEPLLHHILSSFLVKDVAQIGTLSKVLYNAWNTHPYLDFGDVLLRGSQEESLKVVDQILTIRQKQKLSIQKFCIQLLPRHCNSDVDNWIDKLVACSVKELQLIVIRHHFRRFRRFRRFREYKSLPESIFAAKGLNVLRLDGFEIGYLPSIGIKFSSLREFYLEDAFLDDQFIQALCTSCTNLQVLSLQNFEGLTKFRVDGTLHKLHTVKLQHCPPVFQLVDIAANLLECLEIDISYLWSQKLVKINGCKALKTLFLEGLYFSFEWISDFVSSLPNLETFSFSSNTLITMKITSDRLKSLSVSCWHSLTFAELDTPNLIKFHYAGPLPLSTFTMNKASVLLDANFFLYTRELEKVNSYWYSKLIKLLVNFNHSKAIEFSSHLDEVLVIPKDVRENFTHPLYGTSILRVDVQYLRDYSVVDILDSMLWISPHLDTLSFTENTGLKTLKFIYEDASDEDEKPCCASLPWKCWKRKLKEVKMLNFSCGEQEDLKHYFSTNANISKIIVVKVPF